MGHGVVRPRRRPAVVDPRRRRVPVTDLRPPTGGCSPRRAPTSGTRRCSSAGTNRAAPTTTSRRLRCRSPDPASSPGELGFTFDRSGYRVPAIIVSPWVAEGEVFNEEYRHTSLIATLREQWELGDPFTARDAAARTFSERLHPRHPARPQDVAGTRRRGRCRRCMQDMAALGAVLSVIGKTLLDGIREYAAEHNLEIEGLPKDPKADIPPEHVVGAMPRAFFGSFFPLLKTSTASPTPPA